LRSWPSLEPEASQTARRSCSRPGWLVRTAAIALSQLVCGPPPPAAARHAHPPRLLVLPRAAATATSPPAAKQQKTPAKAKATPKPKATPASEAGGTGDGGRAKRERKQVGQAGGRRLGARQRAGGQPSAGRPARLLPFPRCNIAAVL
jgi:hypothetical protein